MRFKEIHEACNSSVSREHLERNVGPTLWKLLRDAIGDPDLGKRNLRGPIERAWEKRSSASSAVGVIESGVFQPLLGERSIAEIRQIEPEMRSLTPSESWNMEHPDVSNFYGRSRQLDALSQWVCLETCRMVLLYGLPGTGKTALIAKLVEHVKEQFGMVIWRSLSRGNGQPLRPTELVADLLAVFSQNPATSDAAIANPRPSDLYPWLTQHACLIVLDGFEVVLQPGQHNGQYLPGYEPYGELLEQLGQSDHQSCVIITSREQPREIEQMVGPRRPVREMKISGLGAWEGQRLFYERGEFVIDSEQAWQDLFDCYDGNPKFLGIVATRIYRLHGGNVSQFLRRVKNDTPLIDDIPEILNQHFERLSELERQIIRCLTNKGQASTIASILHEFIVQSFPLSRIETALLSLRRRSLIDIEAECCQVSSSLICLFVRDWLA